MMDVKKALEEADGDAAKATEILRVKGLKGVTKREGRSASNGLVTAKVDGGVGTLVEVNCETDFVAKGAGSSSWPTACSPSRRQRAPTPTSCSRRRSTASPSRRSSTTPTRPSAKRSRSAAWRASRARRSSAYLHKTSPDLPAQIGVLLGYEGGDAAAKDVAMHIAAFSPTVLTREEIPAETVENERRIAEATAREEGKPEAGAAQDRRGPRQRLLRGERAAGAEVRQGPEEDRAAGAQGRGRAGHRLRPAARRPGQLTGRTGPGPAPRREPVTRQGDGLPSSCGGTRPRQAAFRGRWRLCEDSTDPGWPHEEAL
jgi:elongation factor Ts